VYALANKYLPRIADAKLDLSLRAMGAILIEGPKWCGKTSTAEHAAKSVLYMQDPDTIAENMIKAKTRPSLLLEGATPRLLDEWQVAPVLWNAVRFAVDKRQQAGQFILTGSVVPVRTDEMHSGTGRISRMKMRTMSLYESGESSGDISLGALFDGQRDRTGKSSTTLEQIAFILTRGGWPAAVNERDETLALKKAADYYEAVVNEDKLRFMIDDLPAWSPKLRSKTAIRTAVKRHFSDPSIAAAALGATSKRLFSDFSTFGLLFESLCIRDLRVYADSLNGSVYHYRDASGQEIDAIIQLHDGRWGAAEIKMGAGYIESASESLIKFKNTIDTVAMEEPSLLMILTATEHAFQLENGVWVVPLGCLKN
jgi:predicted AAA+ superfamily ATPase